MRYLIASFMVGSLFAYLNYRSYTKRTVFMLVSLAVDLIHAALDPRIRKRIG